jgi:hypothetical protein
MMENTWPSSPWPLAFENAPTVSRGGREYVRSDVGLELARRIAIEDQSLLSALAAY